MSSQSTSPFAANFVQKQNRQNLLRVRRRQKLERLLQSFCFRDADVQLAERRWKASQIAIQEYDSGDDLSEMIIQKLEFRIRQLSGEVEDTQHPEPDYQHSYPVSRTSSHAQSRATEASSRAPRELVHRPRGEVDEWATLQVLRQNLQLKFTWHERKQCCSRLLQTRDRC